MSRVKCLSMSSLLLLLLSMYSTAKAAEYYVPNCPYDVTTADIDCDGDIDVIVGRNCKYCIAYNEGNFEFTFGDTLEFPCGTLIRDIGDYNNDGTGPF